VGCRDGKGLGTVRGFCVSILFFYIFRKRFTLNYIIISTGIDHATAAAAISPLSFSDAIKKAKVADAATAEAEKVRDEGGQQVQARALQLSKTQHAVPQRDDEKGNDAHAVTRRRAEEDEDEEEEEEVELRMPWVVRL
jgi:hypothetical protein